jgi:hypothetical protein
MRAFLEARPEVDEVISLITLQLGNEVMVSVQARMDDCPSADAMVAKINLVERSLKQGFPEVRWSFFEPELRRGV